MIDNNTNNLSEIQAQWAIVRGKIRQKIGDAQFKSWIKIISLKDFVDGKVILSVPSNFIRTRIIEQYLDIIKSYWLVQNLNYTFRDAYKTTGRIVSYCRAKKLNMEQLTLKELQKFDKKINIAAKKVLSATNSVVTKSSYGGTSPKNTKNMIKFAIKKYLK